MPKNAHFCMLENIFFSKRTNQKTQKSLILDFRQYFNSLPFFILQNILNFEMHLPDEKRLTKFQLYYLFNSTLLSFFLSLDYSNNQR